MCFYAEQGHPNSQGSMESKWWTAVIFLPGEDGKVISRKGATLDREKFAKIKEEYYSLRGWDIKTGLHTRKSLEKLDLQDVGKELTKLGHLTGD